MEIKKLFERDNRVQNQAQTVQKNRGAAAYQSQNELRIGQKGEDSVTISPLSRQLAQLSQILAEDETRQQDRVAELKARVESGSYVADRDAVARSLISFAADSGEL